MRSYLALPLLLAVALFASGCLYANVATPFDTDLDKTDLGSKVGTADAYSILWLVSWGDAGYKAAADGAGIKVLKCADQQTFQVLFGLFTRWRVVVYGD